TVFEEMALMEPGSGTLTGLGEPMQIPAMRVTASLFPLLGGEMHLGRWLRSEEGHDRGDNLVVISYSFWQNQAGGDPNILGRKFLADGLLYTVVGVAGPSFRSVVPSELYVPWNEADLRRRDRADHQFGVLARLKPGITVEQAQAELAAIQQRIGEQDPRLRGFGITVVPLKEGLVESIRTPLLVLMAAVGFVLLIACANVANLLLAKAAAREKEVALRTAIGASRAHLLRQFFTESLMLALMGGALGLLLSLWGVELLAAYLPGTIPIPNASAEALISNVEIDSSVLLFTLGLSTFTGLLFGMVPAITGSGR
ncbi:MAG: FtsX-like permease family protein, partial [bacterium]|nr:FtsX-like permease family protein [bacterium]